MGNDYLLHYGIKGQKWGLRRFQNEDGTYTEEGRVRRRKEGFSENTKKKIRTAFEPSIKGGKDKPPQSPVEKIVKTSGNMLNDATSLTNAISNIRNRMDGQSALSEMSDADLRNAINRLQMERQYSELSKIDSKGLQTVKDILAIAGPTVAIIGGSVGIASTVMTWKKSLKQN